MKEPDPEFHGEEEAGRKGGAAEAHMASAAHAVTEPLAVPVGFVRWQPIAAGAVIGLATMIFLNTLGVGLGLALTKIGYGGGLAYWMVAMAAIGLFIGSYIATRSAQVSSLWTGMLYGATVWATFLLLDVIGVNLFGGLSRFLYTPGVMTAGPLVRNITQASGWWFFIGYLIALVASLLGATAGLTVEEAERRELVARHQH